MSTNVNNGNNGQDQARDQAIARRQADAIEAFSGSSGDPGEITRRLEHANEIGHLVPAITQCHTIPAGCEVALTGVLVDSEVDGYGNPVRPGEIYKIAFGQYGVGKTPLNKIKGAVGVSWHPSLSRRLDDGSDPYYQEYYAFGCYYKLDGSVVTVEGKKEVDLRGGPAADRRFDRKDGRSALCEKIIAAKVGKAIEKLEKEAKKEGRSVLAGDRETAERSARLAADDDIREQRIHIGSNCQTKAELRAIRSIGIKTSYTLQELQKPFIVPSVIWTGRTNDPDLKIAFAMKTAEHFLTARSALFGAQAPAPRQIETSAPPPLSTTRVEDDDFVPDVSDFEDADEVTGHESDAQQTATIQSQADEVDPNPEPPRDTEPQTNQQTTQPRQEEAFKLPNYGDKKGMYLDDSDVTVGDLNYYLRGVIQSLDNPEKAKWKRNNIAMKEAIERELARRGNGPATQQTSQPAQQKNMRF